MASDHEHISDALIDLQHFEQRTSAAGRLRLYAGNRIQTFWQRLMLTLLGSLTIYLLAAPGLGLLLFGIGFCGEVLDIWALSYVIFRLECGDEGPWPRRIALISAMVHAATTGAFVAMVWRWVPMPEARYFAATFLICVTINAGLGRPHFRQAANVRLAVYTVTGFLMMALDLQSRALATSIDYGFFAAGFGMLAYFTLLFIGMIEQNYDQRRDSEHALLKHQHDQALAQVELAQNAKISQRLALVAKYANDSIVISAPGGRIDWVNDAFTRITGYGFAEAVGQHPADILNAPGTDPETLVRLANARVLLLPVRADILNRTKSGRLLWMETSIIPILDDGGRLQAWIAVERDITEAKEREAELARARLAAEQAGQAKSRFLANMSHEIRTPMNGVIGVAELLSDTKLDDTQTAYVETILESGRLLLGIINDILDLAKLQSGKATLEVLPFSAAACIESVLRILGPVAARKGLTLRLDAPPSSRAVLGDEGKLRQIVLNLVGNAIKFTGSGAVTVVLRLPHGPGQMLEIAVADTGIGIASDRIDSIFDSFSQADNGISRQFGGTGLGLTISAMLAEQMGGEIVVNSVVGQGSVFTLRAALPMAEEARAVERLPAPRVARLRPGLRILIAEDNRTNMMIVRKMLAVDVGDLIEACNGAEVVDLYCADTPDLVLMDVSMPIRNGLEATRDIRAYEAAHAMPRCPVVALTANAFSEDREACRLAGLDGFLVKPLSRADLLAEINRHCPEIPYPRRVIGL